MLAANHPTGFMEPCILACHLDRPLYYLVRGDFFKKPLYRSLLQSLHMLPVYRVKDGGLSVVKNNYETFDNCYNALRENKTLMILAEGSAEHEKRLRPLKKGTGRVALGTLERYPDLEDVYIVPVGVNYTYAEFSRSEVMIDFGEPILARKFLSTYKQNQNQAINDLTDELSKRMAERIVIIEQKSDEELTEYLLQMDRSKRPIPVFPIVGHQENR
ncbi:MAG: 1-acyl-sn-glycerol-3-phosphate acyltransferase [Saprospiraceae bacterium]|nr:1-acyl-sn-glycerol-3-phosphate acyltransferase [Saprospiraceae bacterium]